MQCTTTWRPNKAATLRVRRAAGSVSRWPSPGRVRCRSLERRPSHVLVVDLGSPRAAAADPEQSVRDQQVDDNHDIDGQRQQLEHRNRRGQLDDLEWDEDGGLDHGEVLGHRLAYQSPTASTALMIA